MSGYNVPSFNSNLYRHPKTSKQIRAAVLFVGLVVLCLYLAAPGIDSSSSVRTANVGAMSAPADQPSYLDATTWPSAFQIQMVNYVTGKRGAVQNPVPGTNSLYYDATNSSSLEMKAVFPSGTHIPGVPLSFVGKSCEFYLGRNPTTNQYEAAVYCAELNKYFLIGQNVGPVYPDFVTRYHKILPLRPLVAPRPKSGLPVRNPSNGARVQWFQTAGDLRHQVILAKMGYYAALETPIQGPNNVAYKPPYSFTGLGVGLTHGARGQLVYDAQSFVIDPSFSSGTFTPPSGYTQVPHQENPVNSKGFNCVVCHASDPPFKITLWLPKPEKPQHKAKGR